MKDIIKLLETSLIDSIPLLEKIELKNQLSKKSDSFDKTHLNLNIDFEKENLNWIYVSFQWDIKFQFSVIFSKGIAGDWYKKVELGSFFYDLEHKEQIKRLEFFLLNYSELVNSITNDKNIERKKELFKIQSEIADELSKL